MAPPKKIVLRALGDSHLRAIGMVAAQWSSLEFSLLWVLSQEFKIKPSEAVILAGAQNAAAWCEMLRKQTNPPHKLGAQKRLSSIDKLALEVGKLLKLRNDIVHTAWDAPRVGIISGVMADRKRLKASDKATGSGIPKRGSKLFTDTDFTATEMIAVATRIAKVEQDMLVWLDRRSQPNRLLNLLQKP
jgi:hypothetical protein